MTASEWDDYQKRKARASEKANETLQEKLLRTIRRRTEAWWKKERAEEAEKAKEDLAKEPVYVIQEEFSGKPKKGEPQQEPLPDLPTGKVEIGKLLIDKDYGRAYHAAKESGDPLRYGSTIDSTDGVVAFSRTEIVKMPYGMKAFVGLGEDGTWHVVHLDTGTTIAAPGEYYDRKNNSDIKIYNRKKSVVEGARKRLLGRGKKSVDAMLARRKDPKTSYRDYTQDQLEAAFLEKHGIKPHRTSATIVPLVANKFSTALVEEMYGGQVPSKLKRLVHKSSDINPDTVAGAYGYASGRELLDAIIQAPSLSDAAQARAEEVMVGRHGDILNDGTLEEQAREAARNEERGKVILQELRALNRTTGRQTIDRDALKKRAEATIASIPLNELRPDRYHQAEIKAAQRAAQAVSEGNTQAAQDAKLQQAANFYLWRAAHQARQKRDAIRRRLQGMQRRNYSTKTVHKDYIRQLKIYLAAYDFRVSSTESKAEARERLLRVAEWVKRQSTDDFELGTYDSNLDKILAAEDTGGLEEFSIRNYRTMTLAELEAVDEMARHLRFIGGQLADEAKAERAKEHAKAAQALMDNFRDRKPTDRHSKWNKFWRGVRDYGANVIMHADSILRYLDKYADDGTLYRMIKRPIDDAVTQRLLPRQKQVGEELDKIYKAFYETGELREMNRGQDVAGRTMSKWEMIALVLNWGNESSRQAVLASVREGQQEWTEAQVQEVIERLDKRDMDFIQSVWDYVNTFKKELFELERRRHGLVPPVVEAAEVVTPHGTYRGGYYPLKYDKSESFRITAHEADDLIKSMQVGHYAKAHTKDGMLQERSNSGGAPVRLDMMVLHQHVNEVITLISMGEAVEKVSLLLSSQVFTKAMQATGNTDLLRALDVWLKDTAAGEIIQGDLSSSIMRMARVGLSASKMGWNLGTMLVQPLGVFQSMPVVGYGNTLKGIVQMSRGFKSVVSGIHARSPFMMERASTFNKDIRDTLNKMRGDPSKPNFYPDWMRESLFAGIVFFQRYVDTATWLAAYEKGKKSLPNATEADLVHFADRAVARSQASGVWSDRTPIERGSVSEKVRQVEYVRIWTTMASYFFAKANVAIQLTGQTNFRDPRQVFQYVINMLVLFSLEALIVSIMRNTAPDDDDDESYAMWWAKETALNVMGAFPFVREFASEASGFRGNSAFGSLVKEAGDVIKQIDQGEFDTALVKSINDLGGIAFRYPSSAIGRAGDALYRDLQGEDVEPHEYLIWREKD